MCTWNTAHVEIAGYGRGVADGITLSRANVAYDHPAFAPFEHALLIDFAAPAQGVGARVAVELDVRSARELLRAVEDALASPQAVSDYQALLTEQR